MGIWRYLSRGSPGAVGEAGDWRELVFHWPLVRFTRRYIVANTDIGLGWKWNTERGEAQELWPRIKTTYLYSCQPF